MKEIEQDVIMTLCFTVLLMSVRSGDLNCKSPFGNKGLKFFRFPFCSVVHVKIDKARIERG